MYKIKYYKFGFGLFFLLFLNSCYSIHISGFYDDYFRIDEKYHKNISYISEQNSTQKNNILAINDSHIKTILNNHDSSLLYFWNPNCSSKMCISLSTFFTFCKKNNYHPIVLMQHYSNEGLEQVVINDYNVFAMNSNFYKTNRSQKQERLFFNDLIKADDKKNKDSFGRYYYFKKDRLVLNKRELLMN